MRRLRRWLLQPFDRLAEFVHRGRHGWAVSDTWNLDGYLARVMGESIHHLADHTHGWPGFAEQGFEEWQAELHKHADALLAYEKAELHGDLDPRPTLHRLADIWWHLWD
jgi:hypothetical protein